MATPRVLSPPTSPRGQSAVSHVDAAQPTPHVNIVPYDTALGSYRVALAAYKRSFGRDDGLGVAMDAAFHQLIVSAALHRLTRKEAQAFYDMVVDVCSSRHSTSHKRAVKVARALHSTAGIDYEQNQESANCIVASALAAYQDALKTQSPHSSLGLHAALNLARIRWSPKTQPPPVRGAARSASALPSSHPPSATFITLPRPNAPAAPASPAASSDSDLAVLPLDSILSPHNDAGRRQPTDAAVNELSHSISTLGLLQPLLVDNANRLLAGRTRILALRNLAKTDPKRWQSVPVQRLHFDAAQDPARALAIEVAENELRRPYTKTQTLALAGRLRSAGFASPCSTDSRTSPRLLPIQTFLSRSKRTLSALLSPEGTLQSPAATFDTLCKRLQRALSAFEHMTRPLPGLSAVDQRLTNGVYDLASKLDRRALRQMSTKSTGPGPDRPTA